MSDDHDHHVEEDMHVTIEKARADAKREFEQERDRILSCLPPKYKSMFGQVLFSKWKTKFLPCLVLSPYMVPPGPIRDKWMTMFNKLSSTDRTDHFTFLVYWYGTEASQWYSFVKKSSLASFDEVETNGCHFDIDNPPKGLESAYKEMAEDIPLQPHERKRGDFGFREGYELVDERDYHEVMSGEPSPTASEAAAVVPKKAPAKSTSKKKSGKKVARSASPQNLKVEEKDPVRKKQKRSTKRGSKSNSSEPPAAPDVAIVPPDERNFKMCEMAYKSLIENWMKAVDDAALAQLLPLLIELVAAVGQFSPLFIERRNLTELVDRTATLISEGGDIDAEEAEMFADFRRKFDSRHAKSVPPSSEDAPVEEVVEKTTPSEDGTPEKSDKDGDYMPAHVAEVPPRATKRSNKKAAAVNKDIPIKKKSKAKQEKVKSSKVGKRDAKFISINTKFMGAWERTCSSDNVEELKDLLEVAVLLASGGKVTVKFIKENQTVFKNLTKRSKNVLKKKGQDVSIVKTLKTELNAVFAAGEMKQKAQAEEVVLKKPPDDSTPASLAPEQTPIAIDTVTPSEPSAEQQKPSRIQKKRKRTIVSLGSILNSQPTAKPPESPPKAPTIPNPPMRALTSAWHSMPCTTARQEEDPRSLGTEFLEQMVRGCIPDTPHPGSIAIQLETAVFEMCQEATALTPPHTDQYFAQVHKTVAGCCSLKGPMKEQVTKMLKRDTPRAFVEAASSAI